MTPADNRPLVRADENGMTSSSVSRGASWGRLLGRLAEGRYHRYHRRMAQLLVRNLDADVVAALRRRAARHGRSVEAEHRALLRDALADELVDAPFKTLLAEMPDVGRDEDFARRPSRPRPVDL